MVTTPRPHGGAKSLFLIDANNFLFRAYHGLPMLNAPDGTPVNAVRGYASMLQALRREFAPEFLVAIFDAKGGSFRNELYEPYKANRPPAPEDLIPQIALVREATEAMSIPWVEMVGFEADDLIASYACRAREAGYFVTIVSADKDLMQLIVEGDGDLPAIRMWDSMKNRTIGPEQVVEKFGVGPALLGDLLAMTGDSADNIPGVPGIGPKTASALLLEYGDLEGVLAGAPNIKQQKRRESLLEHAEKARLSRRLVALRDDLPLPIALEDLRDPGIDAAKMEAFFQPLGFRSSLAGLIGGSGGRTARRPSAPSGGTIVWEKKNDFALVSGEPVVVEQGDIEGARTLAALLDQTQGPIGFEILRDDEDPMLARPSAMVWIAAGGSTRAYVNLGGEATPSMLKAFESVFADESRAKVGFDCKSQIVMLGRIGIRVAGRLMDAELASYTIDPARSSHAWKELASELLGVENEPQAKAKKTRKNTELALDVPVAKIVDDAECIYHLALHLDDLVTKNGDACRRLYDEIEGPLARVLAAVEARGILLDLPSLAAQSEDLGARLAEVRKRIEEEAGYAINPDSPQQLQKFLFEEKGLPATKKTKTGYSTDADVLEELSLLDPIVKDILEHRSLTKLKGTYIDALPRLVHPKTGRLHTQFKQAVAQTGRLSSIDPNLQNIPIRTEEGRRIRQAFVAPEGKMLVTFDYSQIELRILAHLSKDKAMVDAFTRGADVHRRTAAEIFDVTEEEVTSEQRRVAKAVNFGVIYGQSAFGLARQLSIRQGKAKQYIDTYFEKIPGVQAYMDSLIEKARRCGYAETIFGRRRRIPELGKSGAMQAHGERIARNTPIQGSAADILKVAMVQVEAALSDCAWAQMLLTVHDELIFECEESRVSELATIVRPIMQDSTKLDVPLVVDDGHGRNWAEAKG
jgi:DNA polymerase-1